MVPRRARLSQDLNLCYLASPKLTLVDQRTPKADVFVWVGWVFICKTRTDNLLRLARIHSLSPYTPLCRHCGLVLCEMNSPYYMCPYCASSLVAPSLQAELVTSLETEIANTLADEDMERQRLAEEARKAAGAFPTLPGLSSPSPTHNSRSNPVPRPNQEIHRVLTVGSKANSKSKKVTVYSYATSPTPPRPLSRNDRPDEDNETTRIVAPPGEVETYPKTGEDDLWTNPRQTCVTYVPPRTLR
jgi:hypothetical protein